MVQLSIEENALAPIVVTSKGMLIVSSPHPINAYSPISVTADGISTVFKFE